MRSKHEPGSVKVKLERLSICHCGFTLLNDGIPLGKEYTIWPSLQEKVEFICGGCGRAWEVMAVYTGSKNHGGYMPIMVFQKDESVALAN